MKTVFNVEELQNAIQEMQRHKILKKIKVTTDFAYYIDRMTEPLPHYEPNKFYSGMFCGYQGVPVEIDDEIDGPYEFVY